MRGYKLQSLYAQCVGEFLAIDFIVMKNAGGADYNRRTLRHLATRCQD